MTSVSLYAQDSETASDPRGFREDIWILYIDLLHAMSLTANYVHLLSKSYFGLPLKVPMHIAAACQ